MNKELTSIILQSTGATALVDEQMIQELWSGYGKILRVSLQGADTASVVVKHVQLMQSDQHPRGWNGAMGHQRKLRSYEVESNWYANYSERSTARLPKCLDIKHLQDEVVIVLEDLDEAGYALRKRTVQWADVENCLGWLAHFHASYMNAVPTGLWEVGTYWHLATRPQELASLHDDQLRDAAPAIDALLSDCQYQTLVHGDAKLANFCFADDGSVAGVDFQYVGGGCGMKDVAYFVGSCLGEAECERLEGRILDTYFNCLRRALGANGEAIEEEWRPMYHVAWADFHRFLKGWSPGHWKINGYSESVTRAVINGL